MANRHGADTSGRGGYGRGPPPLFPRKCLFRRAAALVRNAQTACRAAQLKPFIRLLLLLGGNQSLASIATLPDARLGNELRPAAAALFRHGFFERKDSWLLR